MLKCNQVSRLVSSDEVQELGFMKKLEYHMHLFMCGHCKRYVAQIKRLGQGLRSRASGWEPEPQQLERMKDHVQRHWRDNSQEDDSGPS